MNAAELERAIVALVDAMRDLTIGAGVPSVVIDRVFDLPDDLTIDVLEDRLRFLESVMGNEYQKVLGVWSLLSADVWSMYSSMGVTGLAEQMLLASAQAGLRKVWRKKYGKAE